MVGEPVSTPVEQAAAVLAEHFPVNSWGSSGWCTCDESDPFHFDTFEEWAAHALAALQLTEEWGIKYDIFPNDVVLGREENPDGSVTRIMKLNSEGHARQAVDSPAPIGGFNKSAVSRLVGPWRTAEEKPGEQ